MWPFKKKLNHGPHYSTALINSKALGEGSFGAYHYIGGGVGIKVMKSGGRKTLKELKNTYHWEEALKELKTQKFARNVLGDLVPDAYHVIPVLIEDTYHIGMCVEHVEGKCLWDIEMDGVPQTPETIDLRIEASDRIQVKLIELDDKMKQYGIEKGDHHGGNVMVTPSGEMKVIDWGFGITYRGKTHNAA